MKYIKMGLFLCSFSAFAQLHVSSGTQMSAGENFVFYTNEDVENEGSISFIGDAEVVVDAGLDNRNGVINFNDATLRIGSGTSRASSTDTFRFKERNTTLQIGDSVRFVVLNKTGGITNVLEGHLGITDTFESISGTLNGGNHLSLLNRSNTQLAQVLPSSGGTASLETERFIPGRRAFRLLSPSVNSLGSVRENWQEDATAWDDDPHPGFGTHITGIGQENPVPGTNDGTNGFDWQPSGNPSLFVYNNADISWSPIQNTSPRSLEAGEPLRLMIRGSRDVDICFNSSAPSTTVLRSHGELTRGQVVYNDASFGTEENDFILLGNPYHTVVDLEEVYNNSSNIKPFVAVWDPTLGGAPTVGEPGGRGGFVLVGILENETNVPSAMNKFLQPYQAAFFYADGNGDPSIVFSESAKAPVQNPNQVFSVDPVFTLNLLLYDEASFNANSTSRDAFLIRFKEHGNNAIDANDAPKPNNLDENLARLHGSSLLSIEERSLPTADEDLSLFINQYQNTDYVFKAIIENLPANTEAFLIDHYLNETHVLTEGITTVNFSIDPSINASTAYNRFSLSFGMENLSQILFNKDDVKVYPNPSEGVVNIQSTMLLDKLSIYNLVGKLMYQETNIQAANKTLNLEMLETGVYFMEIGDEKHKRTTKFIIK